jgi:hypothetical protein
VADRDAWRLALATVLVLVVGCSRGLDTAVIVALSLVVLEVDDRLV